MTNEYVLRESRSTGLALELLEWMVDLVEINVGHQYRILSFFASIL